MQSLFYVLCVHWFLVSLEIKEHLSRFPNCVVKQEHRALLTGRLGILISLLCISNIVFLHHVSISKPLLIDILLKLPD